MELLPSQTKPILFIWLADCSGSMDGPPDNRIDKLNAAIRKAVPRLRDIADRNPLFPLQMGAIKFWDEASWHREPTDIGRFQWIDLSAKSKRTDMAGAVRKALEAISVKELGTEAIPPILVLVSDGLPTDTDDYRRAVAELNNSPWGKRATRRAIAIGTRTENGHLRAFSGETPGAVIHVDGSAEKLSNLIGDLSTTLLLDTITQVG